MTEEQVLQLVRDRFDSWYAGPHDLQLVRVIAALIMDKDMRGFGELTTLPSEYYLEAQLMLKDVYEDTSTMS